ncbi:Stk1 family PASTA domain-containing Ser/Thr kinase [Microlunatus aurantiacus]|uniref:non-specific serine/threonine protein kinase n=1 Tax=Microlunatus aurantiacus TaxID=446786 RepID=A0ABP7D9V3_9ACTN
MTSQPKLVGGRYELSGLLGRGGMAEVHRALDLRLGRPVAVKELRADLATDPTFQARFRREAQSAAGLNHPTIVAVYDTGEETNPVTGTSIPYIVMELVEGQTLRDVLREGRKLLPERALELTVGVLDALSYSHKAGIVHRDIKPANVMLTPTGQVKVMDFGIARAVADTSATMTQTAAVIGTAQYLSPEQARGETVDARSDIYSAGCLLYELLVGRPPFVGDSPVSVAYQHVREQPVPPSRLDPEITPDIDAITLKALAKDADDRYQSAREFKNDITRVLAGQQATAVVPRPLPESDVPTRVATRPVPTPPPPVDDDIDEEPKKRGGLIALVVVLAVLLLGGVAWGVYRWTQPNEPPPPALVAVPNVLTYTADQATARLEGVGLKATVREVNGPADTKGQVTQQDPIAETQVEVDSSVTITVNQGPETAAIPDGLVGRDRKAAEDRLNEAGFDSVDAKAATSEPNDAKAGQVLTVSPKEGATVPLSTKVTLTYATGESTVPNLVGVNRERAETDAKAAGFKVRFTEQPTDEQPAGLVVSQDPASGSTLARGETISLVVAATPPPSPSPTPTPPPTSAPPSTPTTPEPSDTPS